MDFLKRIYGQLQNVVKGLQSSQIWIMTIVLICIFIGFAYLIFDSSREPKHLLYSSPLRGKEFEKVSSKLKGMNVSFSSSGDGFFFLNTENDAVRARAQLGLDGVAPHVKGFELFDNPSFSLTDFERKVNLRRAITGNIVRHLESLEEIESADIVLSFSDRESFYGKDYENNPLTASVSITPAPFSDILENNRKIKGLRDFIANGVDRLKAKNVVIADRISGTIITDRLESSMDTGKLKLAREQLKIKESIRNKKIREIRSLISGIYTPDRYELTVDIDVDWNNRTISRRKIEPIVLKEDNANTPYDDSIRTATVTRSRQETTEIFKGPAFIPEGPPGTEPNVTPGSKELIDRATDYKKITNIDNNEFSEANIVEEDAPYIIKDIKISLVIDGLWRKIRNSQGKLVLNVDGSIQREYVAVKDTELMDIKQLLEGSLNKTRGDKIEVRHIQFDRFKQFEFEDKQFREAKNRELLLQLFLISIPIIIFLILLFQLIRKELEKRRKLKAEKLLREKELMQEAALWAAKQDGVPVEMSESDKRRAELEESVLTVAKDYPETVATLLRTWLLED